MMFESSVEAEKLSITMTGTIQELKRLSQEEYANATTQWAGQSCELQLQLMQISCKSTPTPIEKQTCMIKSYKMQKKILYINDGPF
jgi:hypothetical protein